VNEYQAGVILKPIMEALKIRGIMLPWVTIYRDEPDLELRLHELNHYLQYKKNKFWHVKYILTLCVTGYKNHPEENRANAYARQKVAEKGLTVRTSIMTNDEYLDYLGE